MCTIVGCQQSNHTRLVKAGDLDPPPEGACDLVYAVGFQLLWTLIRELGGREGRLAYERLNSSIELILVAEQADVVYDMQFGTTTLARSDMELAAATRCGHLLRVVPLTGLVQSTVKRFNELVEYGRRRPASDEDPDD